MVNTLTSRRILYPAVAVLVAVIALMMMPRQPVTDPKMRATGGAGAYLCNAAAHYRRKTGEFPHDVDELYQGLESGERWGHRDSDIWTADRVTDGWGTELRIKYTAQHRIIIWSAGPDRKFGTDDDVEMRCGVTELRSGGE